MWTLPRLLQVCSGAKIYLQHLCPVQIQCKSIFSSSAITGKRQGANTSPKDNRTVPLLKEVYVSGLAIRNKLEVQKANKSTGPDNIQPKLLKLARGAIIPSLESLHQYSIQTKTVFTSWKPAKITPVFQNDEEQIGATIDESP